MELKALFKRLKKSEGLTIIELVISTTIITVLITVVVIFTDPVNTKKKARDNKRLNDLSTIDRSIIEYRIDNGTYPDSQDTLRTSNTLPTGGISVDNASAGWIMGGFVSYTSHLPVDPINDDTNYYSYYHDGDSYELSTPLELLTEEMQNDGGNDANAYEIGNNLSLISP